MNVSRYTHVLKHSDAHTLVNFVSEYEVDVEPGLLRALCARDFKSIDAQTLEELQELEILVTTPKQDQRRFLARLENGLYPEGDLDITLCLTYRCNLACSYCVQSGTIKPSHECEEREYLEWLNQLLETRNARRLHICFFGGEPLIRRNLITSLSAQMQTSCKIHGVDFSFGMTTNGTLLTPDLIPEWKANGLACIDVTMDGPHELHDANRRDKLGQGTFDRIVENLTRLQGLCDLNIVCNIDPGTATAARYVEFIKAMRQVADINSFVFKPYYGSGETRSCFYSERHVALLQEIWRQADKEQLPVEQNRSLGPCGYFNPGSLVVAPDGNLFPCSPFLGRNEFSIGNIINSKSIDKNADLRNNLPRKCLDCAYCPICFGGCRFVSHLRSHDLSKPTCEKKLFDMLYDPV